MWCALMHARYSRSHSKVGSQTSNGQSQAGRAHVFITGMQHERRCGLESYICVVHFLEAAMSPSNHIQQTSHIQQATQCMLVAPLCRIAKSLHHAAVRWRCLRCSGSQARPQAPAKRPHALLCCHSSHTVPQTHHITAVFLRSSGCSRLRCPSPIGDGCLRCNRSQAGPQAPVEGPQAFLRCHSSHAVPQPTVALRWPECYSAADNLKRVQQRPAKCACEACCCKGLGIAVRTKPGFEPAL